MSISKPRFRRKLYKKIKSFRVYIVDGKFIRDNLDEEFTNFGQHYRFKFIPEKEFWVDKEHSRRKEIKYFIDHLMVEHKLMKAGEDYGAALSKADYIERKERRKSIMVRRYYQKLYGMIHKKLLDKMGYLKIWLVHGELVRDLYWIDFTEGGHDLVYHFIPKNEVWIDDALEPKERNLVLLHELYERELMQKSIDSHKKETLDKRYRKAHFAASKLEHYYRHHPRGLNSRIKKEMELSIR
jgi:hypothetical protein